MAYSMTRAVVAANDSRRGQAGEVVAFSRRHALLAFPDGTSAAYPRFQLFATAAGAMEFPAGRIVGKICNYVAADEYGLSIVDPAWPGIIVDAGACNGDFALSCRAAGLAGRIISIEPAPANFALLAANTAGMGVAALRAAIGPAGFAGVVHKGSAVSARYMPGGTGPAVESIPLEALFDRYSIKPEECWLKLDIEGAELQFFDSPWIRELLPRLAGFSMEGHYGRRGSDLTPIIEGALGPAPIKQSGVSRGRRWSFHSYPPGRPRPGRRDLRRLGGNHRNLTAAYAPLFKFLVDRLAVKTAFDVGCGSGWAMASFKALGVKAEGFDGLPANWAAARAHGPCFIHDLLTGPFRLPLPVDLVWCHEVAEHVEPAMERNLVETLANGRIVAMTHALPGQPGHHHHHHVNCRPPEHWLERLAGLGYSMDFEATAAARGLAPETFFGATGLILRKGA
jgi:FkbM family methyltransferase